MKQAVHKATAPKAYAKPKTRARQRVTQATTPIVCPPPLVIGTPLLAEQPIASLLDDGPIVQTAALPNLPGRSPAPGGPGFGVRPPDFGFIPGPPGGGPGIPGNPPPVEPPSPPPAIVPEPASWVSMILGFGAVGVVLRGRRSPGADAEVKQS